MDLEGGAASWVGMAVRLHRSTHSLARREGGALIGRGPPWLPCVQSGKTEIRHSEVNHLCVFIITNSRVPRYPVQVSGSLAGLVVARRH